MSERNSLSKNSSTNEYGTILKECEQTTYSNEFREISRNALPLVFTFVLQFSLSSMTVFVVGRIGALELGGVSLANVTFSATSAVFVGMATCLDTLCPQAFGGKQYKLVGLYFQRGVAISSMFAIPIALLWWFSKPVLAAMVDDPKLIIIASRYLRVMVASIPGYIVFECGKKYLQAQNDFTTAQYILFVFAPLNMLFNYLLVFKLGLGYIGAPIATATTYSLMGLSLALHIFHKNRSTRTINCWNEVSNWREIFRNWNSMISLAVPGIVMIEAEFLAFELLTIISAKFGTETLAAQSVTASIQSLTFQVPFSVGVAASNRIAYHIGTGRVQNCEIATKTTLAYLGSIIGLGNFLFLVLGRHKISALFSNDPGVVSLASQLLPFIGINQLYDVFNVLAAGCLRAQGRQRIGGYLNIVAYYAFGLPLAMVMGFRWHMEVKGFWIGLGVGILILAISELYCLYRSNWDSIIRQSQKLHQHA